MFVSPERTAAAFSENGLVDKIRKIRQAFPTPEDINDSPLTSPSKRIEALYPKYDKVLYGPLAVLEVGLDALRLECHHFRGWLEWLESLG